MSFEFEGSAATKLNATDASEELVVGLQKKITTTKTFDLNHRLDIYLANLTFEKR